jgi:hypothetical protein
MNAGGSCLFLFVCAGFAMFCLLPFTSGKRVRAEWACMAALVIAVCVFHAAVPLDIEMRKLLMIVPPMLMFAAAGATAVFRPLPFTGAWSRALPMAVLAGGFTLQSFTVPVKSSSGVAAAAAVALEKCRECTTYLVSGDGASEGAFIAEVAMNDAARRHTVLRSSKLLASSDWNGTDYQLLAKTPGDIRQQLLRNSVSMVVVGAAVDNRIGPHHALLRRTLEAAPGEWAPVTLPDQRTSVHLYRRINDIGYRYMPPQSIN